MFELNPTSYLITYFVLNGQKQLEKLYDEPILYLICYISKKNIVKVINMNYEAYFIFIGYQTWNHILK